VTAPTRQIGGWVSGMRRSVDREIPNALVKLDCNLELNPALNGWSNAAPAIVDGVYCLHKTWSESTDISFALGLQSWYEPGKPYKITFQQRGSAQVADSFAVAYQHDCAAWTALEAVVRDSVLIANPAGIMADWGSEDDFYLKNVRIRRMTNAELAEHGDRLFAHFGVEARAWTDPSRLELIPHTMDKLRHGGSLKLLLMGDSWINDTAGHTPFEAWLMRSYPECDITLACAAIGGTGVAGWNNQANVDAAIIPHAPDTILVGGISSWKDTGWDSIDDWNGLISKLKTGCPGAEIIVASSANGKAGTSAAAESIASTNHVAFYDAAQATIDFVADAGTTVAALSDDGVHLDKPYNCQLLGRALWKWLGGGA
jgi:hypothetical protein